MEKGDAYVFGSRVCVENSLWSIKKIRKYVVDIEEAKATRKNTTKKLRVKCGNTGCEETDTRYSSHLIDYGFYCSKCSSNTSYPELFFKAYLKTKNIDYHYQVGFDDSRRKIDFYIPSMGVYVEVHGIIHYEEQHGSAWVNSHSRTLESDKIKREWCKNNSKILIELDCRKSEFNFIMDSINNNHILPNITQSDINKIEKTIADNGKYDTQAIIKMYKDGMSYSEIADELELGNATVYSILKRNNVQMRAAGFQKH